MRYRLEESLGRAWEGRLGIWKGWDEKYDRAVRIYRWEGEQGLERWRRQVRMSARLNHPLLLGPLDMVDDVGGTMVVEAVLDEGEALSQCWSTLSDEERLAVAAGMVDLVNHGWARGVSDGALARDRVQVQRGGELKVGVKGFGVVGGGWDQVERGVSTAAQEDLRWLRAFVKASGVAIGAIGEESQEVPDERDVARLREALEEVGALMPAGAQVKSLWWQHPGLFGYRNWSLRGRDEEMERLRARVERARRDRTMQVALISGSIGQGGRRLGRWCARHLMESGVGPAYAIHHTPNPQQEGRVAKRLGIWKENRQISGGVSRWLREFESLDQGRAAMVLVENGHWAGDTLDEVLALSEQEGELPVVVCVVMRPEMVVDRPIEKVLVDELERAADSEVLHLEGLGPEVMVELTRELAPLESEWLYRVAQRSGGSPQYAIRMVHHWVESGLLLASPVREGRLVVDLEESQELPLDLVQLWSEELGYFTGQFEDEAAVRLTLEAAGALGLEVRYEDWEHLCEHLGVEIPGFLVRGLFANQIAREMGDGEGFRFEHSLIREVLERWSREVGRYQCLHSACVAILEEAGDDGGWVHPGRLGTHYLEADQQEGALEHLLEGAKRMGNQDDPRRALMLMVRFDEACDQLGLAIGDRRRMEAKLRRAWAHFMLRDLEAVRGILGEIRHEMQPEDRDELMGSVYWMESGLAFQDGAMDLAFEHLDEAEAAFAAVGNRGGVARALLRRGGYRREQGAWEAANEALGKALSYFEECGDEKGAATTAQSMASVQVELGEFEKAKATLKSLTKAKIGLGPTRMGYVYNSLGELERRKGSLEEAEKCYRQAMEYWGPVRRPLAELARVNLAMTQVEGGQYAKAKSTLEDGARYRRSQSMMRVDIYAAVTEMPGLAQQEDWPEWLDRAHRAYEYVSSNGVKSPDLAIIFELTRAELGEASPPEVKAWADKLVRTQEVEERSAHED